MFQENMFQEKIFFRVQVRSSDGHAVRRDDDSMLKKAMMLEVNEQRKRGQPKMTWRRQVEESVMKVGLKIEKAVDRTRRREGTRAIAEGMKCFRPPSVTRKKPD